MTGLRLRHRLVYGVKLLLPPHEGRESPGGRRLQAPAEVTGAHQVKDLDGLDQPLHRHRPQGGDLHQALHQTEGRRRQPDAAGGGQLLHARSQVGGLPHGRVIHVQVVANGPHHHFPRIEAHAHAQLQAPGAAHLFGGGLHGGLHGQGRIAGAQGVIFVGNRGAKEGHNAVAQHLIHRALEAVHRVHHVVEGGIEELLGGFGIKAPNEFRRVLKVGKEDRDLLAFAFEGGAGGEDLLGQMRGGVAERELGVCGGRHGYLRRERHTALTTELGPWERVRPALGAAGSQGEATLDAKLGSVGSVSVAAWAAHGKALGHGHASNLGVYGQESRPRP